MTRRMVFMLGVGFVAATGTLRGQTVPACSSDTTARQALKGWVVALVTAAATDSFFVSTRDSVRLLPVAASQVSVVTNSTTCKTARNAFAPLLSVPASSISVVVVKAGTRYVVQAPTEKGGEFIPTTTFDSQFGVLRSYTF